MFCDYFFCLCEGWWGEEKVGGLNIYENIRHDSETHKEKKSFESIFVACNTCDNKIFLLFNQRQVQGKFDKKLLNIESFLFVVFVHFLVNTKK